MASIKKLNLDVGGSEVKDGGASNPFSRSGGLARSPVTRTLEDSAKSGPGEPGKTSPKAVKVTGTSSGAIPKVVTKELPKAAPPQDTIKGHTQSKYGGNRGQGM